MTVKQRLAELGLVLPAVAPPPLAVYRPAVRSGPYLHVSGQLASRDGAIVHPGTVGVDVTVEQGQEAARVACLNALAAARDAVDSLDALRVVRLVGYVAATAAFSEHPAVVNGASELLRDVLGEQRGIGARAALGVASLPARTPVEIELLFEVD